MSRKVGGLDLEGGSQADAFWRGTGRRKQQVKVDNNKNQQLEERRQKRKIPAQGLDLDHCVMVSWPSGMSIGCIFRASFVARARAFI